MDDGSAEMPRRTVTLDEFCRLAVLEGWERRTVELFARVPPARNPVVMGRVLYDVTDWPEAIDVRRRSAEKRMA